jgi:hypothetical protein
MSGSEFFDGIQKNLLLDFIRGNSLGDIQQAVSQILALLSLMGSNRNKSRLNCCRDEGLIIGRFVPINALLFRNEVVPE